MPPTECKCVRCYCDPVWVAAHGNGCWNCDGSGFEEKCDACFGPECHECETRVLVPKRDTDGLPFCDGCFEELQKDMEGL